MAPLMIYFHLIYRLQLSAESISLMAGSHSADRLACCLIVDAASCPFPAVGHFKSYF
jgi:hypothetical protein